METLAIESCPTHDVPDRSHRTTRQIQNLASSKLHPGGTLSLVLVGHGYGFISDGDILRIDKKRVGLLQEQTRKLR